MKSPHSFTRCEIIDIHRTLFYVKILLESAGFSNHFFYEYNALNVYPSHIHMEKHKHITAINLLTKGILSILNQKQPVKSYNSALSTHLHLSQRS